MLFVVDEYSSLIKFLFFIRLQHYYFFYFYFVLVFIFSLPVQTPPSSTAPLLSLGNRQVSRERAAHVIILECVIQYKSGARGIKCEINVLLKINRLYIYIGETF